MRREGCIFSHGPLRLLLLTYFYRKEAGEPRNSSTLGRAKIKPLKLDRGGCYLEQHLLDIQKWVWLLPTHPLSFQRDPESPFRHRFRVRLADINIPPESYVFVATIFAVALFPEQRCKSTSLKVIFEASRRCS